MQGYGENLSMNRRYVSWMSSKDAPNARAIFTKVSMRGTVRPASMFTIVSLDTPDSVANLVSDRPLH